MKLTILHVLAYMSSLIFLTCAKSTEPLDVEIDGELLFVEIHLFSYAKQISGNCEQGPVRHGGNGGYEYIPESRSFIHVVGESFPINAQLEMIFTQRHLFVPYSILGGGDVTWVIPVYFTPDQLTRETYVEGYNDTSVQLGIDLKNFQKSINVPVDSIFIKVMKTIEEGLSNSCMWEYTDSLIIRNYGFIPKNKFVRQF